jgi:NarL family two-component system response regulator LiaR
LSLSARRIRQPAVENLAVQKEAVGITTIVCDDQPAFARGLASLLEAETQDIAVVGIANSGEEAERMVRELLPDIVLMDVRLPGISGIEATRRIKAASPTTRIVVLTVSDETTDLYGALRAGATGYILKDKDVADIADALRSVYRGHFVVPSEYAGLIVRDLDASDPSALNAIERQILGAIGRGETNREIASRLHISERTVRRRIDDICQKLHLTDRLEAAVFAARHGFGDSEPRGP